MGKRIKVQRRGQGTPQFQAARTGKVAVARYPPLSQEKLEGRIVDLVHESGRSAPLVLIKMNNGIEYYAAAPEGSYVGQSIQVGVGADHTVGNVLPVNIIPEGTLVNNIELKPGDGGKIARSGGAYGTIISHNPAYSVVKVSSKKSLHIPQGARATIGIISSGGRLEKPYLKAGEGWHAAKASNQVYPVAHGVKMTASSHPHGGGRHRRPGKSTTVGRRLPPGAKVGLIAARTSGRGRSKRQIRE
jgi:large subunit ribosomal protein L2